MDSYWSPAIEEELVRILAELDYEQLIDLEESIQSTDPSLFPIETLTPSPYEPLRKIRQKSSEMVKRWKSSAILRRWKSAAMAHRSMVENQEHHTSVQLTP